MCKFDSQVQVITVLKNEKVSNVPSIQTITKLYNKFLEFGTVLDLPRSGRPKISDEMSIEPIRAIFFRKSQINIDLCFYANGLEQSDSLTSN